MLGCCRPCMAVLPADNFKSWCVVYRCTVCISQSMNVVCVVSGESAKSIGAGRLARTGVRAVCFQHERAPAAFSSAPARGYPSASEFDRCVLTCACVDPRRGAAAAAGHRGHRGGAAQLAVSGRGGRRRCFV
jgi:hypothetical protein